MGKSHYYVDDYYGHAGDFVKRVLDLKRLYTDDVDELTLVRWSGSVKGFLRDLRPIAENIGASNEYMMLCGNPHTIKLTWISEETASAKEGKKNVVIHRVDGDFLDSLLAGLEQRFADLYGSKEDKLLEKKLAAASLNDGSDAGSDDEADNGGDDDDGSDAGSDDRDDDEDEDEGDDTEEDGSSDGEASGESDSDSD